MEGALLVAFLRMGRKVFCPAWKLLFCLPWNALTVSMQKSPPPQNLPPLGLSSGFNFWLVSGKQKFPPPQTVVLLEPALLEPERALM